jgi:hypothetical protein
VKKFFLFEGVRFKREVCELWTPPFISVVEKGHPQIFLLSSHFQNPNQELIPASNLSSNKLNPLKLAD